MTCRTKRSISGSVRLSGDGAWRSETYGAMRDGPSLTPLVMSALLFLPQAGADGQAALRKGADYLAAFAGDDGRLIERQLGGNVDAPLAELESAANAAKQLAANAPARKRFM